MSKSHYSVAEIAERFGLELRGDGTRQIDGVGTLANAGPSQLSFLSNSRYTPQLATTQAGVVVLGADSADSCPTAALIAPEPYLAYARIATLFEQQLSAPVGIHPSAVVSPDARISPSASIGPCCVIEGDAVIEDGVVLGPHCIVGPGCVVGAQSRLVARVTLVMRVSLGKRVLIHPGAVLGSDGFGLAFERDHWIKIPQLGGVRVGDDSEIGANTTIDRGALEDTVLAEDVRLDNQIQVGHNVQIGAHTAAAGAVAIAGSAKIGRYCMLGGAVGVLGHLEIADKVTINAYSLVMNSVKEPGEYSSSIPLHESRLWRRNAARFKQLDDIARRVIALEKDKKHD